MVKRLVRLPGLAGLVLALLALPSARAEEKEPGVQWESTAEMKMQGFSMPPTRSTFCAPKGGLKEPPRSEKDDGRCKMTEVKRDGPKMTWKIECTGKDAMTGEGELVQGKDRYDGKMTMRTAQGDMEMKMSGKKLGGECDAGETKRQVAAIQKQSEEAQAQGNDALAKTCEQAAEDMQFMLFTGPSRYCKDKAQVAKLCARAATRPGFLKLQKQGPEQLKRAGDLCNLDVAKLQARLCASAAADVKAGGSAPPGDALEFLPASCPAEAQALARKECAGRSYTGMPGTWRGFCVQVRQAGLVQGENKPASGEDAGDEPQQPSPEKTIDKAKKSILKGLFGG